jgi:hypothetical protein
MSHGTCTVLGLTVPAPYFLQELILGPELNPEGPEDAAALWRLFVSSEVSEQDKLFVKDINDGMVNWWTIKEGTYPKFDEFYERIGERMYRV